MGAAGAGVSRSFSCRLICSARSRNSAMMTLISSRLPSSCSFLLTHKHTKTHAHNIHASMTTCTEPYLTASNALTSQSRRTHPTLPSRRQTLLKTHKCTTKQSHKLQFTTLYATHCACFQRPRTLQSPAFVQKHRFPQRCLRLLQPRVVLRCLHRPRLKETLKIQKIQLQRLVAANNAMTSDGNVSHNKIRFKGGWSRHWPQNLS